MYLALLLGLNRRTVRSVRPKEMECFDCHEKSTMVVSGYVKTFDLFYLPIFPVRMWQEVSCVSCKASLTVGEMTPETRNKYRPFLSFPYPRPWHFTIIFLLFIPFIVASWPRSAPEVTKDELLFRAETIRENRMITLQQPDSQQVTLRVISVGRDTIQVMHTQSPSELSVSPTLPDTFAIPRDSLEHWVTSEKVTHIYWGPS